MASLVARAKRNQEVRDRLNAALAGISKELGIPVPDEPRRMRDAGLQPIVELERFAAFAESVLAALPGSVVSVDDGYRAQTVKELRAIAGERNIDVPAKAKKADLISALEEADATADGEAAEDDDTSDEGE